MVDDSAQVLVKQKTQSSPGGNPPGVIPPRCTPPEGGTPPGVPPPWGEPPEVFQDFFRELFLMSFILFLQYVFMEFCSCLSTLNAFHDLQRFLFFNDGCIAFLFCFLFLQEHQWIQLDHVECRNHQKSMKIMQEH